MFKFRKNYSLFIVLFTATLSIFQSCKKNETPEELNSQTSERNLSGLINCNARVLNGYLAFDSIQDMNEYFTYLETHTTEDINQFETENGFMSYDRKVEEILKGYEILNEDSTTTMQEILDYRTLNEQYLTITDEDFSLKIEGISNRIVDKNGYLQIGNDFFKYVGKTIYRTSIENKQILFNSDYANSQVTKTEVLEIEPEYTPPGGKTLQVNQWQNKYHEVELHCDRKHRTRIEVKFYAQGPSTPQYGQTGNMYFSVGFTYYLKNMKRGWTGIWYGQSRSSTNTGYYHSSYNGYTNFSNYDYSVTVNRTYNQRTWSAPWNNDIEGAQYWASSILNGMWAYVAGTSYFDVCGPKNWAY